jgi:ABC-type nitrate/sulfonate/bicarbonate transport system substrate-binding protein
LPIARRAMRAHDSVNGGKTMNNVLRGRQGRRLVAAGAGVIASCLVSAALAQPASCPKMDTVKVQEYTGYIVNLTTWVAMDQGILRKYCIEPQIVAIPSAPAAFAASVQGGVDFIMSSTDTTFIPASQGLDVKIVGSINNTIFYAMVVGKHLKLTPEQLQYPGVIKALEGKTIGVNTFGASMDGFARYTVRAAGADLAKYKWVAYGAFPNGVAGLTNGTIDAIEASGDAMDIAAAATGGTITADFRDKDTIAKLPQVAAITGANMMWVSPTAVRHEESGRRAPVRGRAERDDRVDPRPEEFRRGREGRRAEGALAGRCSPTPRR